MLDEALHILSDMIDLEKMNQTELFAPNLSSRDESADK